jgi:hypothetical protein
MIALGGVLFGLTERIDRQGGCRHRDRRAALTLHREGVEAARPALSRVAADPRLRRALARDRFGAAGLRIRELVRGGLVGIELWSPGERRLAGAGLGSAVAWSG